MVQHRRTGRHGSSLWGLFGIRTGQHAQVGTPPTYRSMGRRKNKERGAGGSTLVGISEISEGYFKSNLPDAKQQPDAGAQAK